MRPVVLFAVLSSLAAGCGSSKPTADAAVDAGEDSGPVDMLPRRDAEVTNGDVLQACQRFDPLACPAGETCKVVIRREPGQADYAIFEACVVPGSERGLGDPCDPFGGLADPYRVEGLVDEVYVDPCGEGLFCAWHPDVRGISSCQRACSTSSLVPYTHGCTEPGEYCDGDVYQQVCRASDACNPTDPASCGEGQGCYLRFGDGAASVLTVCLSAPTDPVPDGETCLDATGTSYLINACNAGSHCWGPVTVPPALWTNTDFVCRRGCVPGASSGGDAGADDDAGASEPGTCGSGLSCVDFAASGLDVSGIPVDFGNCE